MKREEYIQSLLPSGYTQLEYIESTGTQYIDTGISAPNGFYTHIKMQWCDNAADQPILASHNYRSPYGRNCVSSSAASRGAWELGLGNNYPRGGTFVVGVDYEIEASTCKGAGFLNVNGSRILTSSDSGTRYEGNLLFFTHQYNLYYNRKKSKYKLKEALIYDFQRILLRSFIPVIREIDSIPGIYDLCGSIYPLTGTPFYTKIGTEEFIYA